MNKMIMMAAVAGMASGALAQSASLHIVASQATVDCTTTSVFTLSVYGDADFGTHITGAAFTLELESGGELIQDVVATGASWGALGFEDLGHSGGGNSGMIMGQLVFLPFIAPDAASALGNGPVFLGSFAVTISSSPTFQTLEWSLGGGVGTFAMEVIDVNGNPGGNPPGVVTQIAAPQFGSMTMTICPSPSSCALLGISGLVVGRRRR
ncbi:MAG: hypothetical protein P1U30_08280 [Phycisphaerales bacterium]|nr:hypothetical protein [Phycisphaerales bacterium]